MKSSFDFKSLERFRFLSIGAEPVRRRDIECFQERFGATTMLQVAYATTETRTITEYKIYPTTSWTETLNSVGRVVEGRTIQIQSETGNWLGAGEVGEILIRAQGMPQAYANGSTASQRAYQRQPDGSVFYATGDVGYLDAAGYLFWCGRTDFMVKRNGQKINLLLVEDELRQAPGVEAVAIVCDLNASVQPLIQAFVKPGDLFDLPTVKRWLANRLPILLLPDIYHIIQELPRTQTGKLDRPQLVRLSKETPLGSSVRFGDPANELVNRIKEIWAQELNYPEPIADYDDFFRDLGGDSLLAEACLATLESAIKQPLPMQLAFSYSTPQALAAFIGTPPETGVQCISLNPPVAGRAQLYFIPPLSGDKRIYQGLEDALTDHANLYCLYFSPFTPSGQLRSLTELSDLIAQLINTDSPNLLLGYSFGGILAYEVALRLDQHSPSHGLNRLVLIDTPLYKSHPLSWVLTQDLKRSWRKLQRGIFTREPLHVRANLKQLLTRYYGRLKPSSALLNETNWQQKADFAARSLSQQINLREPIQRPILLIRATDSSFFDRDIQPDYSWQAYTKSWVDEHLVNTNHYHVLNPTHSAKVARILIGILDLEDKI
ncbi:AMP-binding protein [Spirosoma foliorum]|uniref:AMP-binding protein n=2 Tax=Spirosoma foliorum TaxID=2710596 RepID=A0A7G5H1M4_9BACT|nr:AMP-binding protein [Spirosoma foliorum]